MLRFNTPAAGVDPPHHPLAGEPNAWEDDGRDAEEAGGLQGLQAPAQAPEGAGEVSTGNQLQHPADQVTHQQPPCFHALGGQDGIGKPEFYYSRSFTTCVYFFMWDICFSRQLTRGYWMIQLVYFFICLNSGHSQCVAGPGAGRERLRGVVAHRDPQAGEARPPSWKVSPEGNKSWELGERWDIRLHLMFLNVSEFAFSYGLISISCLIASPICLFSYINIQARNCSSPRKTMKQPHWQKSGHCSENTRPLRAIWQHIKTEWSRLRPLHRNLSMHSI